MSASIAARAKPVFIFVKFAVLVNLVDISLPTVLNIMKEKK